MPEKRTIFILPVLVHVHAVADMTALQTEIRLIVGRLEDFAAKIDAGLEDSDWLSKREMIRALVKRVEVTPDRVNVVFRVDAYRGEASPEKKSWHVSEPS